MLIDPDPRDEEIEDAGGPDPDDLAADEPEVEASDEDEPQVDEPAEGDDETEVEAEPEPQPRKGKTREENFAAVRARERAATERAETAERELQRERATRAQPQQPQQETPEARRTRLAAMAPDERAHVIAAEGEERITRLSALAEFRMADREDGANFAEVCRNDPRAKRYAAEVEQMLLESRKQGTNYPRATILKFILGERVLANSAKGKKQQDVARTEANRQRGNPEKPKGDVGGGKKQLSEAQAREKRLLNQRI